jgi:hypothetical protein
MTNSAITPVSDKISTIIILIIIFVSEDTVTFGTALNDITLPIKLTIYAISILYLAFRYFKVFCNVERSMWLLIISGLILLTSLVNIDFRAGYAYYMILLLMSFLIATSISIDRFLTIFSNAVISLSLISIVMFAIVNIAPNIVDYFPVIENIAGVKITNIYLSCFMTDAHDVRNMSIFREPGVFIIYISIALIIELFYKLKLNVTSILILLAALITSYSTTGYIVFALVVIVYVLFDKRLNIKRRLLFAICFSFIIFIVLSVSDIYARVFYKLGEDTSLNASTLARVASVLVNYDVFLNYPFLGSGFSNYEKLFEEYSLIRFSLPLKADGNSCNSFMSILAVNGILLFSIVITAFYKYTNYLTTNKLIRSSLFLSFVIMLSAEDLKFSLLFNVLIFYGLFYRNKQVYLTHSL